jgi:acyl carrier protein
MPDMSGEIKAIIARQLEIKEERVTETAKIADDLGADSLDVIEFFSILEERFDVQIPDEDGDGITTVGDLVSYIERKIAKK